MLRTSDDEKRLTNQINKITDLEIKATKYESSINSLKEELSKIRWKKGAEKQQRFKEVSELKIRMDSEKMKLDLQLKDLQIYMEERESRKV